MSKKATLSTVSTGYSSQSTLNDNFNALNDALENTVSLDGSTPNAMQADLDLNGNDILNAGQVNTETLVVDGTRITDASAVPSWQGAWVTSTSYAKDDLVSNSGSSYICLSPHTSGTFSTDLADAKWELFAQQGSAGAGTGDLLAANDLSDLSDADTALANLGGGTKGIAIFKDTTTAAVQAELDLEVGTDVQAHDTVLDDLSGLSLVQGDTLYYDGSNLVRLAKGTNGQVLTMNSGSTAPEWSSAAAGPTRESSTDLSGLTSDMYTGLSSASSIKVILDGVSLSGTDEILIRIGDSGGIESTGYLSSSAYNGVGDSNTTGFLIRSAVASRAISGIMDIQNITGNSWVASFTGFDETGTSYIVSSGTKTLSASLDRVRIAVTGSNTFDGGRWTVVHE